MINLLLFIYFFEMKIKQVERVNSTENVHVGWSIIA